MKQNSELLHTSETHPDDQDGLELSQDVQVEVTEMPDGSVLYSAEDGENVVSIFASEENGNKVLINGQETRNVEDLEKVEALFQLDLDDPAIAKPESVNATTSRAISNETGQVEQEVRQALQKEGITVSNEVFERRMGQMMQSMNEGNMENISSQSIINFARRREEVDKVKRATLAEAVGSNASMVNALANKIAENGDVATAETFRQRAYEMQRKLGGVKGAENSDSSVQEFGKAIENAMMMARVEDIQQLQAEAEEGKNKEKAA